MPIEWASSADKHQVPREDAFYALTHAVGSEVVVSSWGEPATVYVGHPHSQTDRYIEVIAAIRPPRTIYIFHVMELSDHFRHLVGE